MPKFANALTGISVVIIARLAPKTIAPISTGVAVTRQGQRDYSDLFIDERFDARNVPYYWIGYRRHRGPSPDGLRGGSMRLAFAEALIRREFDLVILLTGVGTRALLDVVGGAIPGQFIPAVEKGVRQVLVDGAVAGFEDVPLEQVGPEAGQRERIEPRHLHPRLAHRPEEPTAQRRRADGVDQEPHVDAFPGLLAQQVAQARAGLEGGEERLLGLGVEQLGGRRGEDRVAQGHEVGAAAAALDGVEAQDRPPEPARPRIPLRRHHHAAGGPLVVLELDLVEPLVIKDGSDIGMICDSIHRDFKKNFRYAQVWGKSARFPGQIVGLEHKVKDQDIVTIIVKR